MRRARNFPGCRGARSTRAFVDFVLPPEEIAAELARLGADPYVQAAKDEEGKAHAGDGLKRSLQALRTATGVDFASYRQTTIQRRIQRRLTVRRVGGARGLLEAARKKSRRSSGALSRHPHSRHEFLSRAGKLRRARRTGLSRNCMKHRGADEPIRIWVPGCSTGEEAYSLAISAHRVSRRKGGDGADPDFRHGRERIGDRGGATRDLRREHRSGPLAGAVAAFLYEGRARLPDVTKRVRDLCVFARQNVVEGSAVLEARPDQLPQRAHLLRARAAKETHPYLSLRAEASRLADARERGDGRPGWRSFQPRSTQRTDLFAKSAHGGQPLRAPAHGSRLRQ